MRNYFGIHNHTQFSNIKVIDSINREDRMIDYAWDLGMSGIAFTDHDCVSGALKFLKAYQKKIKEEWFKMHDVWSADEPFPSIAEMAEELDFKVVLGNEIYLSEEGLTEANMNGVDPCHFWHYILIAKDEIGFKQIKQLSSAAWRRAWFRNMLRTPTYPSDLFKFVEGGHLIASTACLGGYTAWCWKQMQLDPEFYLGKLDNHLMAMENLFGKGNFFIELQPNEGVYGQEQIEYNKFMINRYWGKYPFVFSTDAHYLKAEEREIHKAFLNSKSSKDREVDEFYRYAYIMGQDEVRSLMPYVTDEQFNEMVANSRRIKDMCKYYELGQKQVVTKVEYEHDAEYEEDLEIFNDVDDSYPNFYHFLTSDNPTDRYLAKLVAHGFVEKYQDHWSIVEYYDRLEEEFWTIREVSDRMGQNMADYFISMAKMIDIMWNEAGSIVGPSRGSAGALLINYLLGITQMDPVEMELPFVWRFLHPSRPDMPDIDVDTESDKRAKVFMEVQKYFNSIGGDIVNICTFGTEGTKSAIKTAGRGLNIDDDTVTYLTSMIPNERGFDWSLHDCYYGNEEEGRAPIKSFVEEMNKEPKLWQLAQNIEGLVTRLGVHASGVVAVNGDFVDHNSFMKTTKEQIVSAFDLHDSEEMGLIKYDFLTVSALDRIRQTMNYMLEDGTIEWQGSLRATYNKYLAPNVLEYDSPEMWDMVGEGKISSLFQFDTLVGSQAIKQIQPRSLTELAISSSLMRLMGDGELPLERYARYKRVESLWYDEMRGHGLHDNEVKILEKYLKKKCGVGESQEVVMQMVMDPQISGFTMQEANKLRKTIAKKQFREIDKVKEMFFEKGKAQGASQNLLSYIWYVQISSQLGYSFSEIHTTGYALIALQEMNLAYRYPTIYWNCACLSVDSSAINSQDFYNLIEENIIETDDAENKKVANKMDYAKLAAALDNFGTTCEIQLPDINKSKLSFTPSVEDNTILYGLKGITRITEPVINQIMLHRPFISLQDFLQKVVKKTVTKDKVVNLIKCGAFNNIEQKDSETILREYIWSICEPKKKLTMQNANMLIDLHLFPETEDYQYAAEVYKLTKELRKHRDKARLWYAGDRLDMPSNKVEIWKQIFKDAGLDVKELMIDGEPRRVVSSGEWDRFYENKINVLKQYVVKNHDDLLDRLNTRLFNEEFEKYCTGDQLQWELDSMNFYFSGHPLKRAIKQLPVAIDRLDCIVEGAQDGNFFIKGKTIPRMKLYTIAGTVIDKDKTKGIVTIQCPDGVVNIKIYKDLFALYNQTISEVDEYGEKEIEEESFFEKGTHLLVTGIQRGTTFVPKVYKNINRKALMKIVLDEEGDFVELQEKEG